MYIYIPIPRIPPQTEPATLATRYGKYGKFKNPCIIRLKLDKFATPSQFAIPTSNIFMPHHQKNTPPLAVCIYHT